MKRRDKYIYVIRRADGIGPIKIGCSGMAQTRLMMMAYWSPYPLALLGKALGTHTDERLIHAKLGDHRLHHEWFADAAPVLAFASHIVERAELPLDYRAPAAELKLTVKTRKWLEMATLFERGVSLAEIAAKYDTTVSCAHLAVRKMRHVPREERLSFFRRAITSGCTELEPFARELAS